MPTVFALTSPKEQWLDANGNPYSGAKLFTYQAGTTTKKATYTEADGLVANSNPIVLNTRGEAPNNIFGTTGAYKLVLAPSTDTDPPASPYWTVDNVAGINDVAAVTSTLSEWVSSGLTPTYVSGVSFTVPGDQTSVLQIGRRLQITLSGSTRYATIATSSFAAGVTTLTLNMDGGLTIDATITAFNYGFLASTNPSFPTNVTQFECFGRLTLTSGVAVTTTDVTAATTVYFTPYKGNTIGLYDGNHWDRFYFTETTLSVPASTSQMYDVFGYMNAGVLTLEAVAWTNDTTRATALATQDGVLVKTGTLTKRYLGSFRTTTVSGQTEDSAAKRYVWNMYNRVPRKMRNTDATTTWTYTLAAFQIARGQTAPTNCLDFVIGVSEDEVRAQTQHSAANTGTGVSILTAIGLDGNTRSADCLNTQATTALANTTVITSSEYRGYPGIGRHYLSWLEFSTAAGTTTWRGTNTNDVSGISGTIFA